MFCACQSRVNTTSGKRLFRHFTRSSSVLNVIAPIASKIFSTQLLNFQSLKMYYIINLFKRVFHCLFFKYKPVCLRLTLIVSVDKLVQIKLY